MLIKKSQTILKHFIGLKFSVWFNAQGSENEIMFCDTYNFFQVDCRSRFSIGKGKEERGKRKEERGKRKEERGSPEKTSKCPKTWFRFLSPA